MFEVLRKFYRQYLSDPQAALLAVLIFGGFSVVILMGNMLLPVIAGIVIAYLLDDLVGKLERYRWSRIYAVWLAYALFIAILLLAIFGVIPLLSRQITSLVRELPQMIAAGQEALQNLPQNYPVVTEKQIIQMMVSLQSQVTDIGQKLVSISLNKIPGLITATVYLILMPLLVFFFLKDKYQILAWIEHFLPVQRRLMNEVWKEMDRQLGNYVRGKFWEMLVVGLVSAIAFSVMGLQYAILLGALIGLSVIIPYIGAVVVTFPVLFIAFFQFGWSAEFAYIMATYGIIQALDGVVLVPLMFSEVVNIHPIAIIVAVLLFGGLWGFWGVFFAIPLATFVQALIMTWPHPTASESDNAF
jgi:putative permease